MHALRIGVVTVARSDYGIYLPVLRRLRERADVTLLLIAGGGHFDQRTGNTIDVIREDGFDLSARFPVPLPADTPVAVTQAMGAALAGAGTVYEQLRPDWLLVLGDRYDMFAAAAAAVPLNIPLAHLHGGEITQGAFDDLFRHAITKLSHLHLVSTQQHADRVIQMGEEPWRVHVCGAPALDNLHDTDLLTREELERDLDLDLSVPPLLATYHPVTREPGQERASIEILLAALEECTRPIIFTCPNADPGNRPILDAIQDAARRNHRIRIIQNLGTRRYFSLMREAAALVGNSSSGLIEAASMHLPVVNVGTRQDGRTRARNVLDAPCESHALQHALERALSPAFRKSIEDLPNPYGDGHAAERIIEHLVNTERDDRLLRKEFHSIAPG